MVVWDTAVAQVSEYLEKVGKDMAVQLVETMEDIVHRQID